MLKLKNIRRNDTAIEADYFPESETVLHGHVSVSLETEDIIERILAQGYDVDSLETYCSHAASGLRRIMNEQELPAERLVMWY